MANANQIIINGETKIDLTNDTVTPSSLSEGVTAHDAAGNIIVGTARNLPVGCVIAYAAGSDPDGYLLCNGAEVSRTTYADLFAVIDTTYGEGDGSTTFALPNLADRFIMGSSAAGTILEAGLPNLYGTFTAAGLDGSGTGVFSWTDVNAGGVKGGGYIVDQCTLDASTYNPIYGASDTVQPPALTMRFYIKY